MVAIDTLLERGNKADQKRAEGLAIDCRQKNYSMLAGARAKTRKRGK